MASEDAEHLPPVSPARRDCLFLLIPAALVVYFPFISAPIRLWGVHWSQGHLYLQLSSGFVSVCPFSLAYIISCTLLVCTLKPLTSLFNKLCLNAMSPLQFVESSKHPCRCFLPVQADIGHVSGSLLLKREKNEAIWL